MLIYSVGGCIRDEIMGLDPKDRDYVVVGATEQQMLERGFKKVGADFPVFLYGDGEEYALARTERKTGVGYHGFEVNTEGVTLRDDLKRRDLTINAMARGADGVLVDYFGGRKDIADRVLRHIDAESFKEDPVRVLRVARFLARWPYFHAAKDTVRLCREMVLAGELDHLTPERVSAEMVKALGEKQPSRFFYFLAFVGALRVVLPEVHALIGVPAGSMEHHPEGDSFTHTMMVLDQATEVVDDKRYQMMYRWGALVHDLGKATSDPETLPKHHGHEMRGARIVKDMCDRLRMSNEFRDYGSKVARYHTHIHNLMILKPVTIVDMAEELKLKQNEMMFAVLPTVSACDSRGRSSYYAATPYPNKSVAIRLLDYLRCAKMSDYFTPEEIERIPIKHRSIHFRNKKAAAVATLMKEYTK